MPEQPDTPVGRAPAGGAPSSAENPGLVRYQTGAVRSGDAETEAWELLSPIGLRRAAEASAEGERKYGPYNWEQGMSCRVLLRHALRHIYLFLLGDRGEDHLAHAAWNLLGACHSQELWPELNRDLRQEGGRPPVP